MTCKEAARIEDAVEHNGEIVDGSDDVFIGDLRAARAGLDRSSCHRKVIEEGSSTVLINDAYAARKGDGVACGANIKEGCPTVLIGGSAARAASVDIQLFSPALARTVRPNLIAAGSSAYRKRITALLDKIASTPVGKDVLARIAAKPHPVTIIEPSSLALSSKEKGELDQLLRESGGTLAASPDPDSARINVVPDTNGTYLKNGVPMSLGPGNAGAPANIVFDPNDFPSSAHPGSPGDAVLLHELGHAANTSEGTLMYELTSADPAWNATWTNWEEYNVITTVENPYRAAQGLPLRHTHAYTP